VVPEVPGARGVTAEDLRREILDRVREFALRAAQGLSVRGIVDAAQSLLNGG
jgi:hypothetical protein